MKAAAKPADASWLWPYGYHEDRTPLRTDTRSRDGCVRQNLTAGVKLPQ